jgi:hypothetical protein
LEGYFEVSNNVTGPIPVLSLLREWRNSSTFFPIEQKTPSPVMAILLEEIIVILYQHFETPLPP